MSERRAARHRLRSDDGALPVTDDADLRERLRAVARERRRFGYRRLLIFLRREGLGVNHKRLFRIYREGRLMVRKRGGRKMAPMSVPLAPNDRRLLDFVSGQFVCVGRFRILAVFGDCTRECLAAIADTSLSGLRAALARRWPSIGATAPS